MKLMLAAALLCVSTGVDAGFKKMTYAEYVENRVLFARDVAKRFRLDPPSAFAAQRLAAVWVHIGPCKGRTNIVNGGDNTISGALHALEFSVETDINSAVALLVIGMTKDGLGREMIDHACTYAKEVAAS